MGRTDCGEYRLGLGGYALGRLPGAEAAELAAHLRGCPPCRAELAELRKVAELLRRTVRPPAASRRSASRRSALRRSALRRSALDQSGRKRRSADRGSRAGASGTGFSAVCAYGPRGPGRSR
ncbi:zf-HC2 domain-containing protein [Actinomadura decatromicini]|uniref:zf-HC2 domain-containing protein n=1 Tax=Actinomadura decatromicini TaxID=2604572 RepID=UPI001CA362ED